MRWVLKIKIGTWNKAQRKILVKWSCFVVPQVLAFILLWRSRELTTPPPTSRKGGTFKSLIRVGYAVAAVRSSLKVIGRSVGRSGTLSILVHKREERGHRSQILFIIYQKEKVCVPLIAFAFREWRDGKDNTWRDRQRCQRKWDITCWYLLRV